MTDIANAKLRIMSDVKNVLDYILNSGKDKIAFEELAQFSKEPQNVKLKTIKKALGEIKKKARSSNIDFPNVTFFEIAKEEERKAQALVRVSVTEDGNIIKASNNEKDKESAVKADFKLDPSLRRVVTKYGKHNLGEREWDVFKYFHENAGRIVSIEELRDKVVFPKFGSKLPAKWYNAVMMIVNNIRKSCPPTKTRLITIRIPGQEFASYMFQ